MIGRVFIGRAGKLLRKTIALLQIETRPFSYYLTNLVCCHPTDEVSGDNRNPEPEEIGACFPRLVDQLEIVNPDIIVCLGDLTYKTLKKKFPGVRHVAHPAYLLRKGAENMKGSFFVQWLRTLEEAVKEA